MRQPRAWTQRDPRTPPDTHHPREQRWRVIYEDPTTNKRRTKGGFRTRALAEAWRLEFLTNAQQGKWIDPAQGSMTFQATAQEWLATHPTDKAKTLDGYRHLLAGRIHDRFGHLPLNDISHDAIRGWVGGMAKTLAPTTVRNNYYVLKAVLDYAVRCRRISANPALGVDLPTPKKMRRQEEQRYPLTIQEALRICEALPRPWDMYARLVAMTGMRPEEAVGLTVGDVDTSNGLIFIRSVVVTVNGKLVREDKAKNDRSLRTVELDHDTSKRLEAYLAEHRTRAAEQGHTGEDLPLFPGLREGRANGKPDLDRLDFSKPMRHGLFYGRYWKRTLKTLGLPSTIRFYDLRHAHISWLVASIGRPGALTLKEVSDRVGHSSAVMTLDRYAHAPADQTERRRNAMSNLLVQEQASNVVPIKRAN